MLITIGITAFNGSKKKYKNFRLYINIYIYRERVALDFSNERKTPRLDDMP